MRAMATPASVSMRISSDLAMPVSRMNFAVQRRPFPQVSASVPSALKMRMRASARGDGVIQISPSAPTPKCRSHMRFASEHTSPRSA